MRRPLSSTVLAVFPIALGVAVVAYGAPPKEGPSKELVDTACGAGLLVQDTESSKDDTALDGGFESDSGGGGLFGGLFGGGSDDGGKKKKGGDQPAPKKEKPKTKLLRPRTEKDKKACPKQMTALFEKYGDRLTAVPAPGNMDAAEIESKIDRVFSIASGPAKNETLASLKGSDLNKKNAIVAKMFDGVKKLDDAGFEAVTGHVQELAAAKAIGKLDDILAKAPSNDPDPKATAERHAAEEKAALAAKGAAPDPGADPRSAEQKAKAKITAVPPAPDAIRPPKAFDPVPPSVAPVDAGPIRQFFRDTGARVSDFVRGSPIANYEGSGTDPANLPDASPLPPGSDQSISHRLPQSTGITPRCEPGCYGTEKMINLLVAMGEEFSAYYGGKRTLSIGGISKFGGGYFPPHVSHQKGIDADISFQSAGGQFDVYANAMIVASVIRKVPDFRHINGREYILCDQSKHAAIGWGLDKLVEQGNLTAQQAAVGKSVLVHWPNHNDHFHVRILP